MVHPGRARVKSGGAVRLATYRFDDGVGPGRVEGDRIVDLRRVAADMAALLGGGHGGEDGPSVPLDLARLLAPVPEPGVLLGVGLNYRDHAAETGRALSERPAVFAKLRGATAPPFGRILRPAGVDTLDYEGELGVVIGRRLYRPAAASDVMAAVAGYVVVNDVTVRARVHPDRVSLAKSAPGHGPFGPWITTVDEVADPHALRIRTWVNGELRQNSSTAELHHRIDALLAFVADAVELRPGDVITTGSPGGSGVGFDPPRFLQPGDMVRVEIEGLGRIKHVVEEERHSRAD
jgi:2-keto-4-pentenoate hydratase/2-oxohepta-3-ene-1,7-dioic acid hydratase in catechol pathway